jgi:hypothetical protein
MTGFLTESGARVLEKPLDPASLIIKVQSFLASFEPTPELTSGARAASSDAGAPPGKSAP